MLTTAYYAGCPYCPWGSLQVDNTRLEGFPSPLAYEREGHIRTVHGHHALDALPHLPLHVMQGEKINYDPAMFRHPEGTRYDLEATCSRCSWKRVVSDINADRATNRARDHFSAHICKEERFNGMQTITWKQKPLICCNMSMRIVKPGTPLAPPTPASDAVTVGQFTRARWDDGDGELATLARQAGATPERISDTVNEEATPDPTPIPPREVVQSYVNSVQDMTAELARLMASAGPERHEAYSWAISQFVSAKDALSDLRGAL